MVAIVMLAIKERRELGVLSPINSGGLQLCSQFEISQLTTTAYHPQGNGQVERAHQTLGRMIGKLEDEYKGQWPRHLLKLTHAYNSTRSAATGYSPHFLMFG